MFLLLHVFKNLVGALNFWCLIEWSLLSTQPAVAYAGGARDATTPQDE